MHERPPSQRYSVDEIKQLGITPKKEVAHKLGFFYRHFTPYFSYAIINHTSLGPTPFTLLALTVPLIASALFITHNPAWLLAGALLHQLGYFFDVLDGEIARIKKCDNLEASYIDSVNHFFNTPILFTTLALGAYLHSREIIFVWAIISLALFSRGSGKYCVFYCIGRKEEYGKRGEDLPVPSQTEPSVAKILDNNTIVNLIKFPWVYPNITVIVLGAALINLVNPSWRTMDKLVCFYAITYPVLDIIECIRIYHGRKSSRMYNLLFGKKNHTH